MTTDVRELLRAGAASPATDVDIDRVMREARGRRRRRGTVGVAGVLVLAVATLGVVRATDGGGSSARIAIGPRQSSEVPDGWTRVELDSGIRYAMPPGWDAFDFGAFDTGDMPPAERRIAIGTARPTDSSMLNACTSAAGHIPTQPGTWLSLWEYPSSSGPQVVGPGGSETLGVVDRPADFRTTGLSGSCPYAGDASDGNLGAAFEIEAFREGGRVFVARVVTAYPASSGARDQLPARLDALTEQIQALGAQIAAEPPDVDALQAQLAALKNQYQVTYEEYAQVPDPAAPGLLLGNEVLNSLRISPLEPATTIPAPTVPATNAVPLPATTVPPLVPTTSDEQAISDLFVGWLRNHPDDETRATVEDGDALLEAIHQGLAQHSAADLAQYSGVVNAIRPIDADHASVDYTLLFAGQPQFGVRTGTAVRIDGVWKVSRDTECSLLSLGGISCPAGSTP